MEGTHLSFYLSLYFEVTGSSETSGFLLTVRRYSREDHILQRNILCLCHPLRQPLDPVLSQMNLVHAFQSDFFKALQDDVGTTAPARAMARNRSERRLLRSKQREQLDSNSRENRAAGREGEVDHKHRKHSPRKRRDFHTSNSKLLTP